MSAPEKTDAYACLRLANQICFPLYACAKEVVRRYREPLGALNLTYTQYIVMMALWEYGSMSEKELGALVHLDSGTLAPLLKRLEKEGYLSRVRAESDERRLVVSLTPQGEALKDRALAVPPAMRGCIDLPPEELLELKRLLDKALAGMNRAADE